MKIAVDIDEVLCESVKGFLEVLKIKKEIDAQFEDIYSYNLWEVFGIEKQEAIDFFDEVILAGNLELGLVGGAQKGMEILGGLGHEIFFITSRPLRYRDETLRFLKNNFYQSPNLIFSGDFHLEQGKSKSEICKNLNIGLIIEDNGLASLKYANEGLRVLLFDKPWNKNIKHENIIRCKDWNEIVLNIKKLGGKR